MAAVGPRVIATGAEDPVAEPQQGAPVPGWLLAPEQRLGEGQSTARVRQGLQELPRPLDRDVGPAPSPRARRVTRPGDAEAERAAADGRSEVGGFVADQDAPLDRRAELRGEGTQGAWIGLGRIAVGSGEQRVVADAELPEQALGVPARTVGGDADLKTNLLGRRGE